MTMKNAKKRAERIDSIIGHHVYFEGILSSKESLRIDGRVKGKVECEGSVVIGSEGKVEGEILADNVFIAGELTGNATARNKLEITEKGKVYGDITTAKLVVDPEVIFEGKCRMISQEDIADSTDSLSALASVAVS
jgi:cytoskeletal protein CcmA (bactofilin family)